MFDADADAIALLEAHGFDPANPPRPYFLACAILTSRCVLRVPGLRARARWTGQEIHVRDGLPPQAESFLVAHELAEYILSRQLLQDELIEQRCDALAAALVAPSPAVRQALALVGRHLPSLAELLRTTQSITALRVGETTGIPLALITPHRVHVRGAEFCWPGEDQLRALASRRHLIAGLERSALTDAPRRTVLVAA